MKLSDVLGTLKEWSTQAQNVIQAGGDLKPHVEALIKTFTGTVSDEELKALQDHNDAFSAELQAPLEPEDGSTSGKADT